MVGRGHPRGGAYTAGPLRGTPVVHATRGRAARVYHGPAKWLELRKKVVTRHGLEP